MRKPNEEELKKFENFFVSMGYEPGSVSFEYTGVIDNYISDCPGYCGKVYIIIGGSTEIYNVLTEDKYGNLVSVQAQEGDYTK